MQPEIIQSMHEQVRAIYRAITGEDVAEGEAEPDSAQDTDETITQRFAELEVIARALPSVMERVPPFTFTPPVDVVAAEDAVLLEVALPGIARDAITIEHLPGALAISGVRRDSHAARGNLFHAEIPRGPFFRIIPLPHPIEGEPRIELDGGVLRIYLTLAAPTRREGETGHSSSQQHRQNTGEQGNDEDGEQRRAAT
jgi:HSP20 family molecular chaperone IbpA